MENRFYNPHNNNSGWHYGQRMEGHNEWHRYLGPCPDCGSRTFNYGGGWRCLDLFCFHSHTNPAPSSGPRPDWWLQSINVFKDGNKWCAVNDDFINLQESPHGFGNNPKEAVESLKLINLPNNK